MKFFPQWETGNNIISSSDKPSEDKQDMKMTNDEDTMLDGANRESLLEEVAFQSKFE